VEEIMKIAVCLSGQPRTWEKCYHTWFKLFDKIKQVWDVETIDIFCHLWNYNSSPNGLLQKEGLFPEQASTQQIPEEEIQRLLNTLNPISFLMEDEIVNKSRSEFIIRQNEKHIDRYGKTPLHWCASQFYSVMNAAYLKKTHELDNNISYDICIKLRFDMFFEDKEIDDFIYYDLHRPELNTVYSCHTGKDPSFFPFYRMGDTFWYADSVTFNRISEYYRWLPILGSKVLGTESYSISTEHAMYLYTKMLGIDIHALMFDPKIYRGQEFLDKLLSIDKEATLRSNELV
jgi:hypothetical protein